MRALRLARRARSEVSREAHIAMMDELQLQRARSVRYSLSAFTRVFSQATNAKLSEQPALHGVDRLSPTQVRRAEAFARLFRDLTADELDYYALILDDCRLDSLYSPNAAVPDELAASTVELTAAARQPLDAEALRAMRELRYFPELARELAAEAPGAAAGQPAAAVEQAAAPEPAKSEFDVELSGIDAGRKLGIIKELKGMLGLGLKEAKDLVEKAPVVLKKRLKQAEAEELKAKLEGLGCAVTLK